MIKIISKFLDDVNFYMECSRLASTGDYDAVKEMLLRKENDQADLIKVLAIVMCCSISFTDESGRGVKEAQEKRARIEYIKEY